MNILLFGVSNVGKTCTGKALANRLGFEFYDLDEENKFFIDNDPVEVIVDRINEEYCLASCECEDDKWTSIQE